MLQFKQFSGKGDDLQKKVNSWLEAFEPDITQMVQTADGDSVVISFLFEESFRGQERRLASNHGVGAEQTAVPAEMVPDKPIKVPQEPGEITSEVR